MFKKKCLDCGKKVERGFNYCPYCGGLLRKEGGRRMGGGGDFGMLGCDDSGGNMRVEQRLPFGMEKVMGSLIKQLEKQMGGMDFENAEGMPKGFSVRISRGPVPNGMRVDGGRSKEKDVAAEIISEKEAERRMGLPRVESESKVRRLGDRIVYEIETPGVRKRGDVVMTRLETGLEIKAYSEDKCYVKFIPLKVEVISWDVEKEKVFVEIRS